MCGIPLCSKVLLDACLDNNKLLNECSPIYYLPFISINALLMGLLLCCVYVFTSSRVKTCCTVLPFALTSAWCNKHVTSALRAREMTAVSPGSGCVVARPCQANPDSLLKRLYQRKEREEDEEGGTGWVLGWGGVGSVGLLQGGELENR